MPDVHTMLNGLDPETNVFSVVGLSNTFFSIPVHPDTRFWFAFTSEGNGYICTRPPEGYHESPVKAINSCLRTFTPPHNSQLLLYADDILVASKDEKSCRQRHHCTPKTGQTAQTGK